MIPPPLEYTVPPPAHLSVGSIAENDSYNLCFYSAKFDAFTPKCTIHLFFSHHMAGLIVFREKCTD